MAYLHELYTYICFPGAQDVDRFSTDPQQVVRLVVGNKADMEDKRQVPVRGSSCVSVRVFSVSTV